MPPLAKKNSVVIIYDCKNKSDLPLKALLKIALIKECMGVKDEVRLLLINSENETENTKGKHIYINDEIGGWDTKLIYEVIENSSAVNGNWLYSLLFALNFSIFNLPQTSNIITSQLLFLSDFSSTLNTDTNTKEKISNEIIEKIKANDLYIYFVGAQIDPPSKMLKSATDVENWMKQLKVPEKDDNLTIVKNIVTKTDNSILCEAEIGAHLFLSYQNPKGMQPWPVPLTIGTQLSLDTSTIRILKYENLLKTQSRTRNIANEITYIDQQEEVVDVPPEDLVKGVLFHSKFVPIEDEKKFKVDSERSFNLFGFTESKNIPETFMKGPSYIVLSKNEDSKKSKVFFSIIDRLIELNMYALAKRVYNKGNNPQYMALIPISKKSSKYFLGVFLPYSCEIKAEYSENECKSAVRGEVVPELYDYLDNLDIDGDKCNVKMPLCPNMMIDTCSWLVINRAADKFLGKDLNLDEVDKYIEPKLEPDGDAKVKANWLERQQEIIDVKKRTNSENESDKDDSDFEFS